MCIAGVFVVQLNVNANNIFSREYKENVWPDKIREAGLVNSVSNYTVHATFGHSISNHVGSMSESLKIPVDAELSSKGGLPLADFNAFYGTRGFSVTGLVNVGATRVSVRMVNAKNEEYRVLIWSSDSYSQAWKDYLSRTALMSLPSHSSVLFQRTSFDGLFAVMEYDPPGIKYAIPEGPFFVEISYVGERKKKFDNRDADLSLDDKYKKYRKHEYNLASIAREMNILLKKEGQMLPKSSPLLKADGERK